MFENFLSILTEREREILRLAFVERYTYAEIAKIYDVSRQYANTTANKALKKIKNQFFQP
jgi:RNA polymerase sigma factor (sigma-70 family)